MCAVAVHVEPGGQQDPVLHRDGAVGEGGDQQLIPPWRGERGGRERREGESSGGREREVKRGWVRGG